MAKLVAKAYGEALFELAMEKQNPEEFLEEAQGILQILEENPEFDKLMKHPKISKPEKEEVVETGVVFVEENTPYLSKYKVKPVV